MATAMQTVRVTRIKNGKDGADGPPGKTYQPIRMRNWEDIRVNTAIQDGVTNNSQYTDIVYKVNSDSSMSFYRCEKYGIKVADTEPSDTATYNGLGGRAKLTASAQYDMIATRILLAANALISLLGSNHIQLYGNDGTLHGELTGYNGDGELMAWFGPNTQNRVWGVLGNGTQFIGGTKGQRIVLDPIAKCMYVYDDSDQLVATHSGRVLSLGMAKPGGTSSIPSKTADIAFGRTTQQGYRKSTVTISETGGVTGSGLLQISVPQLTITAQSNNEEQTPSAGGAWEKDVPTTTAGLILRVTVNGTVRLSRLLANVAVGYNDTGGGIDLTNRIVTTSAVTENVSLETGDKYQIELELSTSISGGQGSGGFVSATTNGKMTAAFVAKAYRCEYAANGWVISYDAQNYEYCLVIDGKLHRMCVCNGVKLFGND